MSPVRDTNLHKALRDGSISNGVSLPDVRSIKDLSGKRVLLRISCNVPLDADGVVENDFRLRRALPTITYLREAGARVILVGHIGRDPNDSLQPVYEWFSDRMGLVFAESVAEAHEYIADEKGANLILLENVRQNPGEKNGDRTFASELASLADVYVNDAFPASHRQHASISVLPELLPAYAGLQFLREVDELTEARTPQTPALAILGGAKFETKLPLACELMHTYDHVLLCGALAHPILQERGYTIGTSLMPEEPNDEEVRSIEKLARVDRILIPSDVRVKRGDRVETIPPDAVQQNDRIVDAGSQTVDQIDSLLATRAAVLWNGPLGEYEHGFTEASQGVARSIAEHDATSVVGGGDTAAALNDTDTFDAFDFVSTAGGAMLTFLKDGTLPGIEALRTQNNE